MELRVARSGSSHSACRFRYARDISLLCPSDAQVRYFCPWRIAGSSYQPRPVDGLGSPSGKFRLQMFSRDHFYLNSPSGAILEFIISELVHSLMQQDGIPRP